MNKASRTVLLAAAGLLLAAAAAREAGLAWLAMPFLSYFGLALLLAPTREEIRLDATRSCRVVGKEGSTSIEVSVKVRNLGSRKIHLVLSDQLQKGMKLVEGSLSASASPAPREEAELKYVFEAARGSFEWTRLSVSVGDPFGLFTIEEKLDACARILVQPSYRRWRPFPLRLDKTLSSPGSIPIRLGGNGTDFWGIREYRQGDSLKRLYWRMNARNPLRRYTKEFIQERTAEVVIVLDGRQRMDASAGGESLFEREVAAVASLAAMLIRQGQRVGLFVMGTRPRNVIPDYGRAQLRRILDCLAAAEPQSERAREALRLLPALRYSPSAFMIVVSPFEEDDVSVFQRLRALGYHAVLVSPDALRFARSEIDGDRLGAQAATLSLVERKIGLNRIANLSFPVVDWRMDAELAPILEDALSRRAPARRSIGWKP
jgi:uncharacterized protein (DUF58 family)